MRVLEEAKPPLNQLAHFGVKGMHWGRHKAPDSGAARKPLPSRPVSKFTTERPRALSTRSEGHAPTREDQLVGRAINQGFERATRPAMDTFIRNIPPHQQSSDPRVNALLKRTLDQGLDRVEADAGREFMSRLPTTFRQ